MFLCVCVCRVCVIVVVMFELLGGVINWCGYGAVYHSCNISVGSLCFCYVCRSVV